MVEKGQTNCTKQGSGRLPGVVGTLLLLGSAGGVTLAFVAVAGLCGLAESQGPWPLSFPVWWSGSNSQWRFLGGLGMLVLGLTPVLALLVLGGVSLAHREWSTWLSVMGLLVVMTAGLILSFHV